MSLQKNPDGKPQYVCTDLIGPAMGGAQLNFSLTGTGPDGRGAVVEDTSDPTSPAWSTCPYRAPNP